MAQIDRLLDIMDRLRDPEGGCPWDLEQDFASISPHTIEEAYEVDEAISSGDLGALRDELGDLLFQVVFQAKLAKEEGAFDFAGVVDAIIDKLVRRHPHIFADATTPTTAENQRLNWEEIKAAERAAAGKSETGPPDPFAGIPRSLPALARSAKITGRIERLVDDALGEVVSETDPRISDLADANARVVDLMQREAKAVDRSNSTPPGEDPAERRARRAQVIGLGLRAWVDLARGLGVHPDQALREVDAARMEAAISIGVQAGKTQVR